MMKLKKKYLILLVIPVFMIFGIVKSQIDENKSKDDIYYLTIDNLSTKTSSLDKTSWIKIKGNKIIIKNDTEIKSYKYNKDNKTYKIKSKSYFCLFTEGILTTGTHEDSTKNLKVYISPKSSMYSGYEKGTVKIKK